MKYSTHKQCTARKVAKRSTGDSGRERDGGGGTAAWPSWLQITHERCAVVVVSVRLASIRVDTSTSHTSGTYLVLVRYDFQLDMYFNITELELELILSRWLWERGEKGGASLQKQARVRALCGVMQ